ncbi:MAG: T9SS type A sorting domain-containing protein [Bacteroidota bacterium]
MKLRQLLLLKTTVSFKQRLIIGGTLTAIALLFGIGTFIYLNTGTSENAKAAIGANMGFENGTTEWTSSAGTWSSDATTPRSGTKSLKNAATTTAARIYNSNSTITTASSGTNYITVIVWAKSSSSNGRVKLGIYNSSTSSESTQASYTTLNTSTFTQITYTIAATNSKTYYPVIYNLSNSGSISIYNDDVMIYTSASSTSDVTEPTAVSAVSATVTGSSVTLNWTAGTDAGSGLDGALILRTQYFWEPDVTVFDQTTYSTSSSIVGPTTVTGGGTTWSVVYNGTNTNTFTDPASLASGVYTYLIFMRDKAGNFTTSNTGTGASRMYVFVGSGTTESINSATDIDGLYIPSGNTFQLLSGADLTINTGAVITINGTLEQTGKITNNGSVTVSGSGIYKYTRNGSATAGTGLPTCTWSSGSTCEIVGLTNTILTGLGQSFSNFKWNCNSQTTSFQLSGVLTTVNGDFIMTNTGSGAIKLSSTGSTLTVGGNYVQTGGIIAGSSGNNNSAYIDIAGNFSISGGTIEQLGNAGNGQGFFINIAGDCTFSGGTMTDVGNPQTNVTFIFDKTGTQIFANSGGTFTGNINYKVTSGSTLSMGTNIAQGNDFTVNSGGGLMLGSTAGITSSGATGNVQVTGSRSFSTGGNYTYNGIAAQVTGSGLPSTVNNLTINNSTGVTLSQTVAVSGILALSSGKVTTGSYEVNVTNTSVSSITSYSSTNYVLGKLRRSVASTGTYDFPIGNTSYELATMKINSSTGMSNLLASFTSGLPATMPTSTCMINSTTVTGMLNCGFWTITPNAYTAVSYDITLYAIGYTNFSGNASQIGVIKRHDNTQAWSGTNVSGAHGFHSNANQSISGGVATAKRTSVTSFSDFGVGYGSTTLPVLLSSFTASLIDNRYTSLNWITSAELNSNYFEVQRSADGKNYEVLGKVNAHGTSQVMNKYSFDDKAPLSGTAYYRLKQVDFDEQFTYSPIQTITNATVTLTSNDISVFPNPATSEINVAVQIQNEKTTEIQILDLSGKKVYSQSVDFTVGQNQFKLPLTDLPAGIYFVSFSDGGNQPVMKKFIKN